MLYLKKYLIIFKIGETDRSYTIHISFKQNKTNGCSTVIQNTLGLDSRF